ncbi:hypothetical protein PV733_18940 [Streptomyces europaeiscabiei]|nr:hypothetical protein [Streptomyces europaeiscabiei]MDX3710994.1 hypothetical protein [Streptomyces europaeiscabiei]
MQGAQVAAELQELRPVLGLLDVAVELVPGEVVGGEQVPDPVRAGVGRPTTRPGFAIGILVPAATFGPLPTGAGLQIERPELVHAEDDFRLAVLGYDLAVGDRVEMLDPGLLGRVVRVA